MYIFLETQILGCLLGKILKYPIELVAWMMDVLLFGGSAAVRLLTKFLTHSILLSPLQCLLTLSLQYTLTLSQVHGLMSYSFRGPSYVQTPNSAHNIHQDAWQSLYIS
mmetsp:Transcript_39999/g.64898  ORF Transcript_39999/g.64898 Transcript_39999/m.64898 type:complete len:108 (-) Transcript_39999:119-442(-)